MSCSDRTPRDRRKANNLALWAALILVALLTGCSAGQPVRGFSGWSAIEVQGAEHYALDTTHETSVPEAAQPTDEGTNSGTVTSPLWMTTSPATRTTRQGRPLKGCTSISVVCRSPLRSPIRP